MSVRRFATALFATIALLGALAQAVWAHKSASSSQLNAMVYHSSGKYLGGQKTAFSTKIPSKCFVAEISTVSGGSSWGAFGFSRYAQSTAHASQCQTGDGIAIAHLISGHWYVVWEGSDGYPPTKPTKVDGYTEQAVPHAVTKDLFAGL